jgi:hypothetical protein
MNDVAFLNPLVFSYTIVLLNIISNLSMDSSTIRSFGAQCNCGKVKATIAPLASAPPLRLVCYCKDCRGYYNTLNHIGDNPAAAKLDDWGGVDWTSIYPRDITIDQGKDLLKSTKIRPESKMRQVYSSCCNTPMFRFGEMSVLMNTNQIPEEMKEPVKFRIIGRNSLAGDTKETKPKMSWSVPFSFFWVMPKRVRKDLMAPMPLELEDAKEVHVLENFKQG